MDETQRHAGSMVREISARETWPVRHAVLRPGQPLSSCDYDIDSMPGSFHLGVFSGEQLVTIGSFYPDPHPELDGTSQYRLRGMATLHEQQGRGLGFLLLNDALARLRKLDCDMLWCNARVSAAGYYIKFGMQRIGEEFDIPNIGPHWLMYMRLD
ncbi:GNAT family N-acetyltransferase [bacterium]|nr:GNAT family N-acetyltransferase [bacterium]